MQNMIIKHFIARSSTAQMKNPPNSLKKFNNIKDYHLEQIT